MWNGLIKVVLWVVRWNVYLTTSTTPNNITVPERAKRLDQPMAMAYHMENVHTWQFDLYFTTNILSHVRIKQFDTGTPPPSPDENH
jgi:hypothetical protein